jgi:hypothetical protein
MSSTRPPANDHHSDRRPDEWGFSPNFLSGTIDFVVTIFVDTQRTLAQRLGLVASPGLNGERFQVKIEYGWHFPVTLVRPLDRSVAPSSAVQLVREFLADELKTRKAPIRLVLLGPSPWHADLWVKPEPTATHLIEVERIPQTGYDDIVFTYDDSARSLEEAFDEVWADIRPELSLYYAIVNKRSLAMRGWGILAQNIENFVGMHTATGPKAWVNRALRAGRKGRRLSIEVLQLQNAEALYRSSIREGVEETYQAPSLQTFREYIERAAEFEANVFYPRAREVVDLLEARRTHEVEALALLVSGVLGGSAGAALTALVTR